MSDKNSSIYEITQLMSNTNIIQNDLIEALNTVKDTFYKKYIKRFQDVLDEHREIAKEQSSKEIDLLLALKPFMDSNSHDSIDKLVDLIYNFNMAQNIDCEIKKYSTIVDEESENSIKAASLNNNIVHDDGVYEIDESCLNHTSCNKPNNYINITELIFMLLISGIIH